MIKMEKKNITAIVLAAGKGKRMSGKVQKQYMEVLGKPLLFYSLDAFENSSVDEIVLVVGQGECGYCREQIVGRFGFKKVTEIVEGGKERCDSVYEGLKAAAGSSHVLIHDGARPCVTNQLITNAIAGAIKYQACVAGMPVKDTIKILDQDGFACLTPDRSSLWLVQTPQAFTYNLIMEAYNRLFHCTGSRDRVTDDAMVVESMTNHKVKLIQGDYSNIKVTTPDDMILAEAFLSRRN